MKFIPAVGAVLLFSFARSRSAYPNRATASFHTVRNFLTERSHHLAWHADDLDISGNQSVPIRLFQSEIWCFSSLEICLSNETTPVVVSFASQTTLVSRHQV